MFSRLLRSFSINATSKDYYKILGVAQTASKSEIRAAYLKLAKQYHPDSSTGNEEKFKELGEAWGMLGNEKSKTEYDSWKSGQQNRNFDPFSSQTENNYRKESQQGFNNPYGQNYAKWSQHRQRAQGSHYSSNWDAYFRQRKQQAREGTGQKTEYYEFIDPKTGKRVIYTFTSSGNSEEGANREQNSQNQSSRNDGFHNQYYQKQYYDFNDHTVKFWELMSGAAFIFTLLMTLSLISDILGSRSSHHKQYYIRKERSEFTESRSKEYVWDDFAWKMYNQRSDGKK